MISRNSAASIVLLVLLAIQLAVYAFGRSGSLADPGGTAGRATAERDGPSMAARGESPVARIPPESLASSFRAYRQDEPASAQAAIPAPEPERHYARFVKLGAVTDGNGVKRIFLKSAETGRIYGARTDGTAEKGVRYFVRDGTEIIVIDGIEGAVEKE